jgi:hypothetical protein
MHNPGMSGANALLNQGDLSGESYTSKAERNRDNCSRMYSPPEAIYTYQWMTDRTEIEIDGYVYRARTHPIFRFVIDLPAKWANEHFGPANEIAIGKKGASIRGMQLVQVKLESGTTY